MSKANLEDTRRDLIALRLKFGAMTPVGCACSNLVEQIEHLQTYERPAWATDERQTLPWMMKRQMAILAKAVQL